MKKAPYDYILKIVQDTNILPVTSKCTTGCVFCSHKNNPPGIEVYSMPELSFDEIMDVSDYLDKNKKIVIGESASRIIEGEPFIREDMVKILKSLRKKYPSTPIEITSCGTYLNKEIIAEIKKLYPIELNISLNSSSMEGRKLLHRDKNISGAVDAVKYLKDSGIAYHGSIVAMPHVTGYGDIEDTIAFLCLNDAKTVRVFVPGFSRLSHLNVDFFDVREKLQTIGDLLYKTYGVPILVEPPRIDNLDPEVCGIIKGSSAEKAGILKGDIITKIDGNTPFNRVDAYRTIYSKCNPQIEIKRGEENFAFTLKKQDNTPSGAVFYYDIDPDIIHDIENSINRYRAKNIAVVTSYLGYPLIKLGVGKIIGHNVSICKVQNKWFGGTIMCAGLLTVGDIIDGMKDFSTKERQYDLIIIPSAPFDMRGRDLQGRYYYEIEETLNIKTVIV